MVQAQVKPNTVNLFVSGALWNRENVLAVLPLIQCRQCGACCKKCKPIVAQEYEVERIAKFLSKPPENLKRGWAKIDDWLWSLPSPCPYRDEEKGCLIYEMRPVTCKYFPIQRIDRDGMKFIGVTTGFCNAGAEVIKALGG